MLMECYCIFFSFIRILYRFLCNSFNVWCVCVRERETDIEINRVKERERAKEGWGHRFLYIYIPYMFVLYVQLVAIVY